MSDEDLMGHVQVIAMPGELTQSRTVCAICHTSWPCPYKNEFHPDYSRLMAAATPGNEPVEPKR